MAKNLDKLSKEELYFFLAEKVGQEAATAIKNEGISGGTLIDLTDTELRDLLPKLGDRRMVKKLVDDFQSSGPSEPKVKLVTRQAVCTCTVYTNHHNHDTVQVAMCIHLCLRISVNGLVGIVKTDYSYTIVEYIISICSSIFVFTLFRVNTQVIRRIYCVDQLCI